jgi:hypothetical protein
MARIMFESIPDTPSLPQIRNLDVGTTFLLAMTVCMVVSVTDSPIKKHIMSLHNGTVWAPIDPSQHVQPVNVIAKVELP